jgi:hypothetical protein
MADKDGVFQEWSKRYLIDEFMRRLMVECFAAAGAFTLTWTLAYGVFEIAGLPKISMWWVFGGTALVWNLWMLRAVRR